MLYNDIAPQTLTNAPKRKFVGSRFDRMLLGISGTDIYGNTTGWGKAKGVVLPALYGTLGAIGTTVAGLGPGVGAKFGSQLGSGINSLSNSFGSNLLDGTDGEQSFENQTQASALQAQTTAGLLGQLGGLSDLGMGKLGKSPAAPATSPVASANPVPAISFPLGGGGSAVGPMNIPGLDFEEDPMQAWKKQYRLGNGGFLPYMFKGGGEVPVWVKSLKALGGDGVTGYNGQVYDLNNLPRSSAPSDNTRVERQTASPMGLEASVINRLTNAENSRYDQRNNVGPGHFGKYQFEPMLITKYAGVSPDEFLENPQLQELAMRRRLADLKVEAESALRKTKSNLPLEDTMVLVHFKGLGQTMKELQNPELMNRTTKHNPSSNTYLYHRSFKERGAKPSVVGYMADFMGQFFAKGGEVKVYADNDDTEDYFMTDKATAEKAGLLPVLNKISFGQARFGERIFDQKSNAFMKKIMHSNKPEKEKISLLGTHVANELLTHSDMQTARQTFRLGGSVQKFKGGGEIQPSKLTPAQKQHLEKEFGMRWPQADNELLLNSLQQAGLPYDTEGEKSTKPAERFSGSVGVNNLASTAAAEARNRNRQQEIDARSQSIQDAQGLSVNDPAQSAALKARLNAINPPSPTTPPAQTATDANGNTYTSLPSGDWKNAKTGQLFRYNPSTRQFAPIVSASPQAEELQPIVPYSSGSIQSQTQSGVSSIGAIAGSMGGGMQSSQNQGSAWMYFRDPKNVERTQRAQQQMSDRRVQLGLSPLKADGFWGDDSEMAYQQLLAIDGNDFRIGRNITKVPTPQGVKVMARPQIRPDKQTLIANGFLPEQDLNIDQNPIAPNVLMNPEVPAKPVVATPVPAPVAGVAPPPQTTSRLESLKQIGSYLPDVGRLVLGATMANNNQPKPFNLGQEYFKTKAELENRRNTGLSPDQRALYTNQLGSNYAAGSEALRSAVAGGGSTGALVAGLGRLGGVYSQGIAQLNQLDADQRRQNFGNYQNFIMQDLGIRQGLFNREEAIRGANRAAGGALMAGALDNAQQRYDFNRQYGPGSQYEQMSNYMTGFYKESAETQRLQNEAFKRRLTRPQ